MKIPEKEKLIKFLKFCITGGLNTLVDFCVFFILSYIGVNIYIAQGIGYSAGIANSFIINRRWTFKQKGDVHWAELVRFIILNLASLVLSIGLMYVFSDLLGLKELYAKLFTTAFTVVVNFIGSNFWVFKKSAA